MPLPGIGEGFFTVLRNTIVSGFLALPIVLITLSGFLATSTANVGFILVFLAQIFVIPLIQIVTGKLRDFSFIQHLLKLDPTLSYAKMNKLCSISPADVTSDMVPPPTSYWMANVIFFFTYALTNAVTLYTASSEKSDPDPTKVENRKAQAITAIILLSAVYLLLLYNYVAYVGCETPGSVFLALLLYVPLGYGWYRLAELCGLRTADVFGIAGQLYIPGGDTTYPYACVNLNAKTGGYYNFGTYGNLKPDEFVAKFISKDVPSDFVDLTYRQDNQGTLTFTLVLNKNDAALDTVKSMLLAGLADNFRKAFDTPDTTRVTQASSGANNRIITLTASPRTAYAL